MITLDLVRTASAAGSSQSTQLTVYVGGEVDLATAPALQAVVAAALTRPQQVVVDLTEVTFMDSSGMAALVELRHLVIGRGRDYALSLAGIRGNVERAFKAAQLISVFHVVDAVPRGSRPDGRLTP